MSFLDWSQNPANNTAQPNINWSEGQLPGTVNGSARQMMADLAVWRDAPVFVNLTVSNALGVVAVNASGYIACAGAVAGTGSVAVRGGATGQEGGQFTLGWAGTGTINGQANGTWNLDVDFAANGNNLRLFAQNMSGSTIGIFNVSPATGRMDFNVRPSFAGQTPWDSGNLTPGNYALLTGANFSNLQANGSPVYTVANLNLSSYLTVSSFGNSLSGNGYQRLPNGLILQWGSGATPAGGIVTVTFPIAFPNGCLSATVTNDSGNGIASAWHGTGAFTASGMKVSSASPSGPGSAAFRYMALGF